MSCLLDSHKAGDPEAAEVKPDGLMARLKTRYREAKEEAERENCPVCKLERSRGNFEPCSEQHRSAAGLGLFALVTI